MSVWIEPQPVEPAEAVLQVAGHPLIAQILVRRGLRIPAEIRAFLDPSAYEPAAPTTLPDLLAAAEHLQRAIQHGQRILVWGDFDVDGQTATSLLVAALRELQADVRFYIPHRLHEGHGIRLPSLQQQLVDCDVLLTCDTGVDAHEAIAHARDLGVTVLVTDHHDLPPQLPPADAIVDPKRMPPEHPLRELPGVGVAYKVMQALYRMLERPPDEIKKTLDLVALGIVADVATQTGDTRYLLQLGMAQLRQTQRIGLQALMQIAQLNPANLTTDHIGFALGPRLNALGRLGDANLAVDLLTTENLARARILAAQLEGLNSRRQLLTTQIEAAAQELIVKDPALLDHAALVISGPRWHPGIIGIVANRLAETYERPTVVISEGDDGQGRGSARSVPGVDIHAAISATEELLTDHGGHPGAAGVRLPLENILQFRRALARAVDAIWERDLAPRTAIDATLPWGDISLDLLEVVNALAPFGQGNPPVVLASPKLELVTHRLFGRDQAHRRLTIRADDGTTRDVIWWRGAQDPLPNGRFDLAYTLKSSDYRGERGLQIEFVDARVVEPLVVAEVAPLKMIDQRRAAAPTRILQELAGQPDVAIWAEGYPAEGSPGQTRLQLKPAQTLVIWTPPAGPRELRDILERVRPQRVMLFDVPGPGTDPQRFVPRLAGMIKFALRQRDGLADLAQLAAVTGQRIGAVREGIYLLRARGFVTIVEEKEGIMRLTLGDGQVRPDLEQTEARLRALLQETAAYRVYYGRTDPERLLPHQLTAPAAPTD
jgi:single-stranded-DNA-specific exonuclease